MNSFYGGPAGQAFEIVKVFSNKVAMQADLKERWQSSISVGSYVFISYGLPSDDDKTGYSSHRAEDAETYGKTYNSTLWQKIYTENSTVATDAFSGIEVVYIEGNYGLGYRLIGSLTGNTPSFNQVLYNAIEANQNPTVTINSNDIDNPVLTFNLPKSYKFVTGDITTTEGNAGSTPSVSLNKTNEDANDNTYAFSFTLPTTQKIKEEVKVTEVNHNGSATASLSTASADGGSVNEPVLKLSLPKSQSIAVNQTVTSLDPGFPPQVSPSTSADGNTVTLSFSIPTTAELQDPTTNVIAPSKEPSIDSIGTAKKPQYKFNLPRAVKFYYGTHDGTAINVSDSSVSEYQTGDYYINQDSGFIYEITRGESQVTFTYKACLSAPSPSVSASAVLSAFVQKDGKWIPNTTVEVENDIEEGKSQALTFKMPAVPAFTLGEVNFIGSSERDKKDISLAAVDKDTMSFGFTIPEGSKIYSGNVAPSTIAGSLLGDIYVDTELGYIYELQSSGWVKKDGSIKGSVGSSLKIVRTLEFRESSAEDSTANKVGVSDSADGFGQAILDLGYGYPSSDEVIAIQYTTSSGSKNSYWCYYARATSTTADGQGTWGRALLTGGVADIIQTIKSDDSDVKTYSVSYVNALEKALNEALDKIKEDLPEWGSFEELVKSQSTTEVNE